MMRAVDGGFDGRRLRRCLFTGAFAGAPFRERSSRAQLAPGLMMR